MSKVSKWNAPRGTTLSEAADGEYVLTPDYDALRAENERLSGIVNKAWNKSHVLESGSYIPGALDAWKRPVLQHLPYGIFGSTSQTANQYCNGWNDAGGYWKAHADDLLAELAALKAVPDGYVVPCDVMLPPATRIKRGCSLNTLLVAMAQREEFPAAQRVFNSANTPAPTTLTRDELALLFQPVAGEREAFEARMLRCAPSCNLQRIGDRYACIDMQWKFDVWMDRAALSAPAAGHQPIRMPTDELESVLSEAEGVRDLSDIAHGWYEATECIARLNAAPIQQSFPAAAGRDVSALVRDAERYRWLRTPEHDVALVIDKVTGAVPSDELGCGGYRTYEYRAGADLDSSIDAALAAHKAGGGANE